MIESWLSPEERKAVRKELAKTLSFEGILSKYSSRVEHINSSTWTHKACCPFHKGGQERTPSFHISDSEKTFFCYGCNIYGDIFDFIGLIRGSPGELMAMKYQHSKKLDIDLSKVAEAKPRTNISEIHVKISSSMRDYLRSMEGKPQYEAECQWADSVFKRMDERFSKLTPEDGDQARSFSMQIMLELERRKYEC